MRVGTQLGNACPGRVSAVNKVAARKVTKLATNLYPIIDRAESVAIQVGDYLVGTGFEPDSKSVDGAGHPKQRAVVIERLQCRIRLSTEFYLLHGMRLWTILVR